MQFCSDCGGMMALKSSLLTIEKFECYDCGATKVVDKMKDTPMNCTDEQEADDTGRGVSTREPSHPLE